MKEKIWLTVDQVAAALGGLHLKTVRRHIRDGWLKAERLKGGNGYRVELANAQKWARQYYPKRSFTFAIPSHTSAIAA